MLPDQRDKPKREMNLGNLGCHENTLLSRFQSLNLCPQITG